MAARKLFDGEPRPPMHPPTRQPYGSDADLAHHGVWDLDLGSTAMGALARLKCQEVADAARLSDEEILSVKGVGPKTLAEIRWELARHHLEHTDEERARWQREREFKHRYEVALSEFMHGWLDDAPEAQSRRMYGERSDLNHLDERLKERRDATPS